MSRYLLLLLLFCCAFHTKAQLTVIDQKGSKIMVDSSKWTLTGTSIYNKNAGNVGIGASSPAYKLDVAGKIRNTDSFITNSARIITLTSGSVNDSILTADPATGIVRRIAFTTFSRPDSTTAANGLTLNGKTVQLGGALTSATTITTTAGNTLALAGLTSGNVATDSILVVTAAGIVKRINPGPITGRADSTTASNGLTLNGKDVRLGGSLTQATTVTSNSQTLTFATGGSALNVTGLASGSVADSFLVTDAITGQLRRVGYTRVTRNDSTAASNGLTLSGKTVQLGGNLAQATTITSSTFPLTIATGGTALNVTGLASGTITADSLVTTNNSTGRLNRISPSALVNAQNLKISSGRVNTIQNIDTASSPKFLNLTLTDLSATGTGGSVADGGGAGIVVNDNNGLLGTQSGTGILSDDGSGSINYIDPSSFVTSAVTSLSGGSTGLTPSTATTGNVTLSGMLNPANGGTGMTSIPGNGALPVGNGTTYSLLAAGASGTVLKGSGTGSLPVYGAVSLTGDVAGTLPIARGGTNNTIAYTTGSVVFSDGTKLTERNAQLFWDNTNFRLGIGKANPIQELDVNGDIQFNGALMVGPSGDPGSATYVLTSQGAGSAPKWALAPGASGSTVGNGPWLSAYTGAAATDTATKIHFGGAGGVGIQNSNPTARLVVGTTFTDALGGNVQMSATGNTTSAASFSGFVQIYPKTAGQTSRLMLPNIGYTGVNGKLVNNTNSSLELQNFTSPDGGTTQTPLSAVSLGGTSTTNGTAAFLINNTTQLVTNSDSTRIAGKLSLASDFRPGGNAGTAGQVLLSQGPGLPPKWNATSTPDATPASTGAVQLAGDLNGTGTTAAAPRVGRLQGNAVSATAPIANQLLSWNATTAQWEPTTLLNALTTTVAQANSAVTYINVSVLQFDAAPGRTYRVKLWIVYSTAATTTGIRLGPNAFSGGNIWYTVLANSSTTGAQQLSSYNAATPLVSTACRALTGNVATIEATVQNTSGAASTVSFQFASEIAASAITILPGSRLEYEIVN